MKVIIMGCGRVGARLAGLLAAEEHAVTILDNDPNSFRRLPPDFRGKPLVGNGIDEAVLKKAGIEEADAFISVTQGDNRNVMAAQIARHIFNVPRVICRLYDPLRQEMYSTLGLDAFTSTTIIAEILKKKLEN
ncbi:potassium channel family protein [Chloroflexota bacterium]